ncbi:MAG: alpha/beta hydrolase-fold protein [bacterium]|nr:alpha/beta hydrolase-fold protein [bacterium]
MMLRPVTLFFFACCCLLIAACDPMMPVATPVAVIVTAPPSLTPIPRATDTPFPTRTPLPTSTPDYTPTPTLFPCEVDSGQVIEINQFPSEIAGGENLRYRVYLPPCYYETERRFPYVVLLHGLSYRETQWEDIGVVDALDQGIRLGALPPMILVMPYYGAIGGTDSFPPDASYENVILDELLPAVERDLCTINQRDFRALGGISRGGFWALEIGFRHPQVFGILGGHSAFVPDPGVVPAAFSPLDIVETSPTLPEASLRIYLDNGSADTSALTLQTLSDRLRSRNISHTYVINPGGDHSNDYWAAHVSDYLAFYGRNWPRAFGELPPCAEPSP